MIKTYEQILNDLEHKKYAPVYFLAGEEPYFIDRITEHISKKVLPEEQKAFNQIIVYGKDTDAASVVNLARRFPMMSEYLVVIVKEAQEFSSLEAFEFYFKNPLRSTILVINYKYKSLSSRLKVYKALEAEGIYFDSKKIYEDKVPVWAENYLRQKGVHMDPGVGMLLTEYLGNDLCRITGELDKLMISLPSTQKNITIQHIEQYIGISKEYNNFELTHALARKDVLKSNRIARHFGNNPRNNPLTLTLTALFFFFSKVLAYQSLPDKSAAKASVVLGIRPFFLKEYELASKKYPREKLIRIISLLREYDLKSKGVEAVSPEPSDLLKELIYKILH